MTALRVGEHVLHIAEKTTATATKFGGTCSTCDWQYLRVAPNREEVRAAHRQHLEQIVAERYERWEAQDA